MILNNIYEYLTLKETIRFEGDRIILGGIVRRFSREHELLEEKQEDNIVLEYK